MFDYIAAALTLKRRHGTEAEKPSLESVIADNIQATRDLADTITRYDMTVTRHIDKTEHEDCEHDHPRRRAFDRR